MNFVTFFMNKYNKDWLIDQTNVIYVYFTPFTLLVARYDTNGQLSRNFGSAFKQLKKCVISLINGGGGADQIIRGWLRGAY